MSILSLQQVNMGGALSTNTTFFYRAKNIEL